MKIRLASSTTIALALAALALSPTAFAGPVSIATGDYPPFVGEKEYKQGVTAAIVAAVFKSQGYEFEFKFLPWKRGYIEAGDGIHIGTFPYLKNAEREAAFLYSEPLYADHFRLFVRRSEPEFASWEGKAVCVPAGYETTFLRPLTTRYKIRFEHPAEMSSCLKMLAERRVDAVWSSEPLALHLMKTVQGYGNAIRALDLDVAGNSEYFFIVSKKLPDAQLWIKRFNAGLA